MGPKRGSTARKAQQGKRGRARRGLLGVATYDSDDDEDYMPSGSERRPVSSKASLVMLQQPCSSTALHGDQSCKPTERSHVAQQAKRARLEQEEDEPSDSSAMTPDSNLDSDDARLAEAALASSTDDDSGNAADSKSEETLAARCTLAALANHTLHGCDYAHSSRTGCSIYTAEPVTVHLDNKRRMQNATVSCCKDN